MSEDETKKQEAARIRKHLADLSEHYDSVHIFCTRHESGELDGTVNVQMGSGNWFARYGQIKSWTVKEDECTRISARKDNEE